MKTLGILCLIVAAALCSSCYEYENPLDPDNPNNRLSTPSFNPPGGTYTSAQSVSISCATGGATIRYTTNGSEPTETSSLYSSPISITGTTTVIAKAFKSGYNPSQTASSTYTINLPYVATPSFNPPGGTYTSAQSVSISCATGGATIRYTTNGSEPTETSSLYSSPISITGTTTVIAKAFKSGYNPSQTASSTYTINLPYVATPSFNPPGGTYTSVQSVSISCSTSGASIRYTTNGNEPTETSSLYSSPISITSTTTIKAKAFKSRYNPSQTASSAYTINLPSVSTPTFIPPGGTYTAVQSVSISCATGGASIRYTTNGNEPTETSSLYSSPISITSTTTIKAKAFKSGYNPSQTASSAYTINLPSVSTPTITPPGGTYTAVQSVSISCATGGASIRYTTNGNEPTETSSLYSSPISITSTTTIKAKAFKSGYNPSQTASSAYTINLPSVSTPTFIPPGGTYTAVQSVSISCATGGASIRYTTNGNEPTETSSLYSSPISITSTTTIKAKAFKSGYNPSQTATSIYTINLPPIWVDNFNDLAAWTNTTNGSYGPAWYISTGNIYISPLNGSFAASESQGSGLGDVLSRVFTFTTDVRLSIWMNKYQSGWITIYLKVNGVSYIEHSEGSGWVQRQCIIPSGTHTITIETNFNGSAGVDDLEIYAM